MSIKNKLKLFKKEGINEVYAEYNIVKEVIKNER
jgi:hypothetical protein